MCQAYEDPAVSFPNFAISGSFDYTSREQWAKLATDLETWLIASEASLRPTDRWRWGSEAFWIAFTSAYPTFPGGNWPRWSPGIPMDGEYLRFWFSRTASQADERDEAEILNDAWLEFQYALARLDSEI